LRAIDAGTSGYENRARIRVQGWKPQSGLVRRETDDVSNLGPCCAARLHPSLRFVKQPFIAVGQQRSRAAEARHTLAVGGEPLDQLCVVDRTVIDQAVPFGVLDGGRPWAYDAGAGGRGPSR
jgi:hypothetical protein